MKIVKIKKRPLFELAANKNFNFFTFYPQLGSVIPGNNRPEY